MRETLLERLEIGLCSHLEELNVRRKSLDATKRLYSNKLQRVAVLRGQLSNVGGHHSLIAAIIKLFIDPPCISEY